MESLGTRQTGRSNFELSESGAVDLLVDTLQFHLDGLYAASASRFAKRRSVAKIVETVALLPSSSLQASGLVSKLSKLLTLLKTEDDELTCLGLLNLGFLICLDDTGTFHVPIGFNANMLTSVFSRIIDEEENSVLHAADTSDGQSPPAKGKDIINALNSVDPSAEVDADASAVDALVGGAAANQTEESRSSRFHKKRVFKAKVQAKDGDPFSHNSGKKKKGDDRDKGSCVDIVCEHESSIDANIDQSSQKTNDKANTSPKLTSPDRESFVNADEYAKRVSSLSPDVCKSLVGSVYINTFSSRILALLLVNRLLKSLVQSSTNTSTISVIQSRMITESSDTLADVQSRCVRFQTLCIKDFLLSKILNSFGESLQKIKSTSLLGYVHDDDQHYLHDTHVQRILQKIDEISVDGETSYDEINASYGTVEGCNELDVPLSVWSELWLQVGIFDGLCFRFAQNQQVLSHAHVYAGNERESLPVALLHILTCIKARWLYYIESNITDQFLIPLNRNHIALESSPEINQTVGSQGVHCQQLELVGGTSTVESNDESTHQPSSSATGKLDIENDDVLADISMNEENDETGEKDDEEEDNESPIGCRHRRFVLDTDTGKVGCAEVFIDTLKCLISLSHRCDESSRLIFDAGGIQILASYLDLLYSIRHRLNDRRIMETKSQSCSPIKYVEKKIPLDASLTPTETNIERIVFDSTLCILTLLTNLMEYEQTEHKKYANNLLNCEFSLTTVSTLALNKVSKKTNLLNFRKNDFLKLLVLILLRESSVFMKTLDETNDCMVIGDISRGAPDSTDTDLSALSNANAKEYNSDATRGKIEEKNGSSTKDDNIPVSEMILSAHICLLIHAILYIQPEFPEISKEDALERLEEEGKMIASVNIENNTRRDGAYSSTKDELVRYLPKNNLWLPIRILKAFLYLEKSTDCLVMENMTPVLDVIHVMGRIENED